MILPADGKILLRNQQRVNGHISCAIPELLLHSNHLKNKNIRREKKRRNGDV